MPADNEGGGNVTETCEFCTVFMEPGTQICGVCGETQTKYKLISQNEHMQFEPENPAISQNIANQSVEENAGNQLIEDQNKGAGYQTMSGRPGKGNQSVSDATGDSVATAASNVGKMIEEEQDQVIDIFYLFLFEESSL
jgi:hypothetical protein